MSAEDRLALALSEWQRQHQIADGDPMLALLDLVRLALQHPLKADAATASMPPSFEEFRGTLELLDTRSKAFVSQSTALIGELRNFSQSVHRLNRARGGTAASMFVFGLFCGVGVWLLLWK